MNAKEIGEIIIWVAAVIGALTVIWHKAIKPPIRFAQRVEIAMCRVEHELGNNGGGTLRDHVDKIAEETRLLAQHSDHRHQAIESRLSTLETHLLAKPQRATRRTQTATTSGGTRAQ